MAHSGQQFDQRRLRGSTCLSMPTSRPTRPLWPIVSPRWTSCAIARPVPGRRTVLWPAGLPGLQRGEYGGRRSGVCRQLSLAADRGGRLRARGAATQAGSRRITRREEWLRPCWRWTATAADLIKYIYSGNFNALRNTKRSPANWWDNINYGHERLQQRPGVPRLGQMAAAAD